jgi:hypothetical protein
MTDNTPMLPGELARLETSAGGAIVATAGEFKGRRVVDVRKYYAVEGAGLKPTRKGLAIEVDRLPALAALVGAALNAARAQGLLPAEGGDA